RTTTALHTLSLHDALPICPSLRTAHKSCDRSPQADQAGEPEGEISEQRHLRFGDRFVPRPALRQHVGRVDDAIALQSPNVLAKRSEEHTSELQSRFDLVCR